MKANEAPEKIYVDADENWHRSHSVFTEKAKGNDIEYIRADAFIDKALKWYCLDCECNDNYKDTKCFFYRQYERYLKGEKNAIPPKFSDRILNEDGSTSDNWCYRHFIVKMQEAFIEKACDFLKSYRQDTYDGMGYIAGIVNDKTIEDFKNYMKGE